MPEDANAAAGGWTTYRVPVLCHLLEAQHLTDIHQIQYVLLEAAATKANRS